MENKDKIYCHRAYRRIYFSGKTGNLLRFAALCVPFILIVIVFASDMTFFMSAAAKDIFTYLSGVHTDITVKEISVFGKMYLVDFMGKYPKPGSSAGLCAVCIAGIWLLAKIKRVPRSITLYASFVLMITAASAAIFLLFPDSFPYNVMRFSDFYLATEIGIWIIIPIVMSISLILLPANIFEQYAVIASVLVYSVAFGFIRYVLFLYLLHKFSYIFMATMFIAFDPPLDTVYIVSIYSVYASIISKRLQGNQLTWKC